MGHFFSFINYDFCHSGVIDMHSCCLGHVIIFCAICFLIICFVKHIWNDFHILFIETQCTHNYWKPALMFELWLQIICIDYFRVVVLLRIIIPVLVKRLYENALILTYQLNARVLFKAHFIYLECQCTHDCMYLTNMMYCCHGSKFFMIIWKMIY